MDYVTGYYISCVYTGFDSLRIITTAKLSSLQQSYWEIGKY